MMAAIRASQLNPGCNPDREKSHLRKETSFKRQRPLQSYQCLRFRFIYKKIFPNGEFLRDAFNKFFNQDLMRFFEERGLKLKIERQCAFFP